MKKKKKLKSIVSTKLLKELRAKLQGLVDSKVITWGKIYDIDFKEEFNLPFGGHTAHKIYKGNYVSKHTIMKGLEHFKIKFELNNGFIDTPTDEEE